MNSMPLNGINGVNNMLQSGVSPSCIAAQANLMNNPNPMSSVQQAIDANGQQGTSGPMQTNQQPTSIQNLTPQQGGQAQQQVPDFSVQNGGSGPVIERPSTLAPAGSLPGANQLFPNIVPEEIPVSFSPTSLQYLNGFLRSQIGRRVTVEFLVGSNTMSERSGILLGVGVNYILLNEIEGDDVIACDFYNIKFIHFYF